MAASVFAGSLSVMSEDHTLGEDPLMMMKKMEEDDGEDLGEEQIPGVDGTDDGGQGETEGSKIDASKNEEDEGWVIALLIWWLK